ncbi:CMRF35-like molecule 5 [Polypterus senegalus]|uniref:CMRF35-like molecule 5 n=1 Tax=Polypterus senegalus TaxID=55291 RepID=UPI001963FEEC|nr:CMRF35-like molecule 5 [Polypterus senegalus]
MRWPEKTNHSHVFPVSLRETKAPLSFHHPDLSQPFNMAPCELALVFLFSALYCTTMAQQVSANGLQGGSVKISCYYSAHQRNREKYFCQDPCTSEDDVLIRTTSRENLASWGRFSIFDYSSYRVLFVTITDLQLSDSGKYYCGISVIWSTDFFIEVQLTVNKVPTITVSQLLLEETSTRVTSAPAEPTSTEAGSTVQENGRATEEDRSVTTWQSEAEGVAFTTAVIRTAVGLFCIFFLALTVLVSEIIARSRRLHILTSYVSYFTFTDIQFQPL